MTNRISGAAKHQVGSTRFRLIGILLAIVTFLADGTGALAAPRSLRSDVSLRKIADSVATGSTSMRLARDPSDGALYYLKRGGQIFRLDPASGASTLVTETADHGQSNLQGFAIDPAGTFYLVNNDDIAGTRTRATIVKGVRQPNGSRLWSVLARSAAYPRSATAYDHRFNAIIADPDGDFVYVNSGSRTDHGEIQTAGGLYPDMREVGLTACILKLPTSGANIFLRNNREWLRSNGFLFAEGTRNTFDFAFAPNGDLFGTENGPGRDDPEELNWLRPGLHYGFPWRMGGNDNPQQFADYRPEEDKLLNPLSHAVKNGYYHNDPTYPPRPGVTLVEPIRNFGPDADKYRDPVDGLVKDASGRRKRFSTFTAHRSPLGLVFDREGALAPEFRGDGFMLSWTKGSPTGDNIAGPFRDESQDLLHLDLTKTGGTYTLRATKIAAGFNKPIDAEIIGNTVYVLEYGGNQSIWAVSLPQ